MDPGIGTVGVIDCAGEVVFVLGALYVLCDFNFECAR
jgi:hypothetical protein